MIEFPVIRLIEIPPIFPTPKKKKRKIKRRKSK